MRILIIAPHHPQLPDVAGEAAAASNAHPGSILLAGQVTEEEIAAAVGPGGFDLFWLATHGSEDAVMLSNTPLTADRLIPLINASTASTVYLNTCTSISLAQRIVDETPASVIATVHDVDDGAAMRTGKLFAQQLAATADPRQAYERSKPARNRHYVYLQARPAPAKPKPAPKPRAAAPRKRGGQPKNRNAATHGAYLAVLPDPDRIDLATIGLEDEIAMLRARMRAVLRLGIEADDDLDTATANLDALGTASVRLATLLRTQQAIAPSRENDVAQAIGDALAAVVQELRL